MIVFFGSQLDGACLHRHSPAETGVSRLGPNGLMQLLETALGLSGAPAGIEYLRLEAYRQVIRRYLEEHPEAFFAASFQADQFATASDILARRDELLGAGWDFSEDTSLPPRLLALTRLEALWAASGRAEFPGFADRLEAVLKRLSLLPHPISELHLLDPFDLLPRPAQRLLGALAIRPEAAGHAASFPDSDLGAFQEAISLRGTGKRPKKQARGDGSLLLLHCATATEGAEYLAQLLHKNPGFRPALLIPEKNRTLDAALVQEGLPSLGIQSASLARPSLQILKLVPAFIWTPIDPYKILEFVSLPLKPLPDDLAQVIATQMAQSPGLQGEDWNRAIARYFDDLRQTAPGERRTSYDEASEQYRFWFGRKRYPIGQDVPVEEAIQLYEKVRFWALEAHGAGKGKSLLVLAEQARRIAELLRALPEEGLSQLDLERIVRTIYEPSPLVFQEAESGHLAYTHQPGAFLDPVEDLVWWNFVETEPVQFFSRWYPAEIQYLAGNNVHLEPPSLLNQRHLWRRAQPVLNTTRRLILVIPGNLKGESTTPHPLMGDLEAAFNGLGPLRFFPEKPLPGLDFQLPGQVPLAFFRLGRPVPFIQAPGLNRLAARDNETFSSLNALFYYPYQWVFQYKLKFRKSSILSIVPDETLMGNLAHRVFEKLLQEPFLHWSKTELEQWVDQTAGDLFHREGAVLLLYGREPERVRFLKLVQYAAWSLVCHIRDNQWEVESSEQPLEGEFEETKIKGIADLILRRNGGEKAVVDLKWSGAGYRADMIRSEEDLQLVLYSHLACEQQDWAHTGYFIISRGQLLARTNDAFRDIIPLTPQQDPREVSRRIWERMGATFRWRMQQLASGAVEVRCAQTLPDLELAYQDEPGMLDFLEMKSEDARYDDYRTLINLLV